MVVFLVFILCMSCSSPFGFNTAGYDQLSEEEFSSWSNTAKYSYIAEKKDYWKSPIEFERDGGGDCEDFCIYLMYQLGEDASMLAVKMNGIYHSIVEYHGYYLEPQKLFRYYKKGSFTIAHAYSYNETMRKATRWGTKSICH